MKNKLWYLTGVSLKRKIKSKWFVIVNIILMFAIVGLFNIDSIIGFFGGDFNEKQKIYVIDNTNTSFEIFKDSIEKTDIIIKICKKKDILIKNVFFYSTVTDLAKFLGWSISAPLSFATS